MWVNADRSTKVDLAAVESEARHLLLAGELEEARDVLQEAREQCLQVQDFVNAGALLRSLGDLEWSLGRFEAALRNYEQAQGQFRRVGRVEDEAEVLLSIGDVRARLGIVAGAQEAFQTSATVYESLGKPLQLAHSHFKLGALARNNPGAAEKHFVRAEELYDQVQKLDPHSMFRVENPPLPETIEDCRSIEPWIMLEVVRRDLTVLRGQVVPPRKKKRAPKPEPAAATTGPVVKSSNRDVLVAAVVVLMVTALFGVLVLGAKLARPDWIPFGKIPFFILGLIASGFAALALRSSEIESKVLSGAVPVLVGCLVYFGTATAFEESGDASSEALVADALVETDIGLPWTAEGKSPDAQRREIEELLARFEKAGDRRGEADTLYRLAGFERSQNRNARALDLYSRSYGLFHAVGAPGSAAEVAISMGEVLQSVNRLADARAQYLAGAGLYERQGDSAKRAAALMRVGDVERSMGRPEAARQAYLEAFGLVAASADLAAQVEALLRLAQVEVDSNRLAESRKIHQQALSLAQKTEDEGLQAKAWLALGELESVAGDGEAAQASFKRSAQLAASAGDPVREVVIWQRLGKLEQATNQLLQASESFRHALRAAERSGDRDEQAATLLLLAQLDSEAGRLTDARAHFTQAMAIYADRGKDTGRGHAAIGLGDLEVRQGRAGDARDTYRLALRFYEAGGSTNGQIEALERLSKVVASADPALAKSYAAKASGLRKQL